MPVKIKGIAKNSILNRKSLRPGDTIISINSHEIHDVLDYQFHITAPKLVIELEGGRRIKIKKSEHEDLGLTFESYLMDSQQRCRNNCMFCFIDQLPPGMRDTLYFKDDDSRLSFLQGNYITLTNISEREINRILEMHISPINISVHTTNPALRAKMMGNKHAGEALSCLKRFAEGGISMNCQLVLCPGINDGDELRRSLQDLEELYPAVSSVAVVPVGITKFRENLVKLTGFDAKSARNSIEIVDFFASQHYNKFGEYLFYAADELYLKAGIPIPKEERYDDFAQYENGVGMAASLESEFMEALKSAPDDINPPKVTIATGVAAAPILNNIIDNARKKWHNLDCEIISVKNEFFGESIDVAGLLTGQDVIRALKGRDLGEILLLPAVMFRAQGDLMLDGTTLSDIREALSITVKIVENSGESLLDSIINH